MMMMISFSASTLVGWQQNSRPVKSPAVSIPKGLFLGTGLTWSDSGKLAGETKYVVTG